MMCCGSGFEEPSENYVGGIQFVSSCFQILSNKEAKLQCGTSPCFWSAASLAPLWNFWSAAIYCRFDIFWIATRLVSLWECGESRAVLGVRFVSHRFSIFRIAVCIVPLWISGTSPCRFYITTCHHVAPYPPLHFPGENVSTPFPAIYS